MLDQQENQLKKRLTRWLGGVSQKTKRSKKRVATSDDEAQQVTKRVRVEDTDTVMS